MSSDTAISDTTFDRAVKFVLDHEGGLSDNPNDPGGLTNWGISQRSYPQLDIRGLTREAATLIYYKDYWLRCKCQEMPTALGLLLFDSAVNQGPAAAVGMLQRSLRIKPDGIVGPRTIAAVRQVEPSNVVADFAARRAFQYAIHPQVAQFGLGWYRRLIDCLQVAQEPLV